MSAWPFHSQVWSISNFPCSLTRNITSPSIKNLTFHSPLKGKMVILPFRTQGWVYVLNLGGRQLNTEDVEMTHDIGFSKKWSLYAQATTLKLPGCSVESIRRKFYQTIGNANASKKLQTFLFRFVSCQRNCATWRIHSVRPKYRAETNLTN